MTFAQFLSILSARKWVTLMVLALVVATTLAVSLVLPKQYTATASVVIDVKPDPVTALSNPAVMLPFGNRHRCSYGWPLKARPSTRQSRSETRPLPRGAGQG